MPVDRDVRQRKTPPVGVAQQIAAPLCAPLPVTDDVTGKYSGIELDVKRLERWRDQVTPVIYETRAGVSTLIDLAGRAEAERERRAAQDAAALASKRGHVVTVIKTLGVAIALIVAAYVGRGAL